MLATTPYRTRHSALCVAVRGSIKSSLSPLQLSGSPAPPFSPRPAPHARLTDEAFLPLIRFTELRHLRYRRREPVLDEI
ncbi:hypothetical protein ACN38_g10277 [Penicillium nordicum]|uniref:Uncharacterized protein n=1 Tax=Penicillium nordicum TaxID=229535 RepID=A0A0M8P0R4_9EURO|nr:hypothetical protein ACN38_g10277 [Penicillium nordicum]